MEHINLDTVPAMDGEVDSIPDVQQWTLLKRLYQLAFVLIGLACLSSLYHMLYFNAALSVPVLYPFIRFTDLANDLVLFALIASIVLLLLSVVVIGPPLGRYPLYAAILTPLVLASFYYVHTSTLFDGHFEMHGTLELDGNTYLLHQRLEDGPGAEPAHGDYRLFECVASGLICNEVAAARVTTATKAYLLDSLRIEVDAGSINTNDWLGIHYTP